jgi:hypothetical protein
VPAERSNNEAYYQRFEPTTSTSNTQTQIAAADLGPPPHRTCCILSLRSPPSANAMPSREEMLCSWFPLAGLRGKYSLTTRTSTATGRETLPASPLSASRRNSSLLQKPEQVNLWYCYLAATSRPSTMEKKPKKNICIACICSPRLTITRQSRQARLHGCM